MTRINNKLRSCYLEFHVIQSFPVSCLNRDDIGAPKTAIWGGVERARVSSQCWKRAIRKRLHESGAALGVRTKKIDFLLMNMMIDDGLAPDKAQKVAEIIGSYIAKDTLVFISQKELRALFEYAKSQNYDLGDLETKVQKKSNKDKDVHEKQIIKILKDVSTDGLDALDIALFGRMVAKISSIGIEAATSFNHALSTHRTSIESDYFTASDDLGDGINATHVGEVDFNSATYYRYFNLNLGQLAHTIFGDVEINEDSFIDMVKAFVVNAFVAIPTAKQNSQAAYVPWDYGKVLIRKGQPIQASFERPVEAGVCGGYSKASIESLNFQLARHQKMFGELYGLKGSFEIGGESDMSVYELVDQISAFIQSECN